mmetsp:Transcript_137434/g.293718  ORF Transcript_137434/g.293718 Transcript_137434/m.293718 type:complete len:789 (+) Transcript_137434:65-2431(+)
MAPPIDINRLASEQYAGRELRCELPDASFTIGDFEISWSGALGRQLYIDSRAPRRPLIRTVADSSFLTAGYGHAVVKEKRGFFRVGDEVEMIARGQVIEAIWQDQEGVSLSGSFWDQPGSTWCVLLQAVDDKHLAIKASAMIDGRACNRLCLSTESRPEEEFFGFGAQFTHMHMKGRRVPVLCQEPGIGRGLQPLTGIMEKLFQAGGSWSNSYAPSPVCLSTDLRGFCLENSEYAVFDLSPAFSLRIGVFTEQLQARIFHGASPGELLEAYTRFCGRMRPLPAWVHEGAIIGMQGGTARVREMLAKLQREGTAIAAFWLQDWVGKRKTAAGSQLWWNWELDREQYPDWEALVGDLRSQGIRVLTYMNPFMVDVADKRQLSHDYFAEAMKNEHFVRHPDGKPYEIKNTTFSAYLMDLTNPACRENVKRIIRSNLIGVGASGWMADYAEALPFDACLHGKQDAAAYHNLYPVEWARVNREAIAEAGLEDEALFFTRSGYHQSPGVNSCFWLGDHLTSWSQEDGIKSVVVGLLSSGLSGMSLNHADIGGYTSTHVLPIRIRGVSYTRSQELLMRWAEMSAFTAVFRTHEGNIPHRNHQITDSSETLRFFARCSRIYAALAKYRNQLCMEAARSGLPLVRHPWLHYPNDSQVVQLKLQYMFGADFMVAPVLDRGVSSVRLYLPEGTWEHLWSGQVVNLKESGGSWLRCSAPLGYPPVFVLAGSGPGRDFVDRLEANGDKGATWSRQACAIEASTGKMPHSRSWSRGRSWRPQRIYSSKSADDIPRKEAWPHS